MMNNRLKELFQLYIDDKASPAEVDELSEMVNSGQYGEELEILFGQLMPPDPSEKISRRRAGQIRNFILARRARGRVRPVRKTGRLVTAIAVGIVLFIAVAWWLFIPENDAITQPQQAVLPVKLYGPAFCTFEDSSTVLLNRNSELTYPSSFDGETREVLLTGEAYFDVRHDPDQPFVVRVGDVKTTVLGTAFNVKAVTGRKEVIVTVARGKVAVGNDQGEYDRILANEQLAVNAATGKFQKTNVNIETALAWKDSLLILDNVTMEEAARLIGARFHKKVTIRDPGLKESRITTKFINNEGLERVLEVLCKTKRAKYFMRDNEVIIEEKRYRE